MPLDDRRRRVVTRRASRARRIPAGPRIRPTFRPDAVVALDAAGWRDALSELEVAAGREVGDYATFVDVLAERRAAFKALGATATDHAATSADTTRLADREAAALFAAALAGSVSNADARRFEAHMLNEFARMSSDDGLVMQLHVGSLRDHNGPLAERFGHDIGADIPVATDWTRGLRPLLEAYGNEPGFAVILFTLDESTYSRELAPLAGHYPAVLLGCPWWFHDSPAGIDRFLDRVTETAGLYNLAGFVDDARALTALPARHDLWRRRTCGWLARKVEAGFLDEDEARRLAWELAYGLVRRAYRLLDAAEGVEAAVDRDHGAGHERRGSAAQPDHGACELVRLAEAPGRRRRDDPLAACGQRSGLVEQERAILLADEEAGRDGVRTHAVRRELDREPPRQVLDGCLRGSVADDARERAVRRQRRDVDDRSGPSSRRRRSATATPCRGS